MAVGRPPADRSIRGSSYPADSAAGPARQKGKSINGEAAPYALGPACRACTRPHHRAIRPGANEPEARIRDRIRPRQPRSKHQASEFVCRLARKTLAAACHSAGHLKDPRRLLRERFLLHLPPTLATYQAEKDRAEQLSTWPTCKEASKNLNINLHRLEHWAHHRKTPLTKAPLKVEIIQQGKVCSARINPKSVKQIEIGLEKEARSCEPPSWRQSDSWQARIPEARNDRPGLA